MENNDFTNVKVGDQIVWHDDALDQWLFTTVTRVTTTMFMIPYGKNTEKRFSKRDGLEPCSGGYIWHRAFAYWATGEYLARVKHDEDVHAWTKIINELRNFQWRDLTMAQLEKIYKCANDVLDNKDI